MSHFVPGYTTRCDRNLLQNVSSLLLQNAIVLLQNAAILSQNVTIIAKCIGTRYLMVVRSICELRFHEICYCQIEPLL